MKTIRKDIFDKIAGYDKKKGTNFSTLLVQKVNGNTNDAYCRGVIHGLLLALTQSGVITRNDAIDVLDMVKEA